MHPLTYEVIRSSLSADNSVSPKERKQILNFIRSGGQKEQVSSSSPPEIIRREEAARRLGEISLRTIDLWAEQGLLTKIKLPGRKRACGFSSIEVDRLAKGEIR